jgi:O-antigen/teichoic acid export membrane protein
MKESEARTPGAGRSETHRTETPPRAQGLLGSFLFLAASSICGQVIGFVALALVARRVGPHTLGGYNFASNLASFFALPLMGGVAMVGTRELAVARLSRLPTLAGVQGFLVLNGVLAYLALVIAAPLLSPDPLVRDLIPIVGLPLILNALGLDWAMQGLQRARPLALFRLLGQVAYIAVLVPTLTIGVPGVRRYAICNIVGVAVTAALTILYVRRTLGFERRLPSLRRGLGQLVTRARTSLAPAASLVALQVYYSIDVLIIGYLRGDHAVGEYTVAQRLPLAVTAIAQLWVTVFYPHAARLSDTNPALLTEQVGKFASLSLLAALPLVPIGFLAGPDILAVMFGHQYAAGGLAFGILFLTSAAMLFNSNIGNVLLAIGDDRAFLRSTITGAVVNVGLNLVLVPTLGIEGSAIATVFAELSVIAIVSRRFRARLGPFRLDRHKIVRATGASAAAALALLALRALIPWWCAALSAGLLYLGLLAATRAVSWIELKELRRIR